MITGFRVARGGAQDRYGVLPDLTIMGKIMGGGLPAAAYGGRRELMERIAPAGDVYQAGTLSGNPLATAAALATLRKLDDVAYAQLAATTEKLAGGLRDAAAAANRPVQVQCVPGLLTVFFADRPVHNYAGAAACDTDAYGAWCRGLLARGVYPPASQFEAWFPSLAHTETDIAAHGRRRRQRRSRRSPTDERPRPMSDPGEDGRDGAQALRDALHEQGGTVAEVLERPPPAARRTPLDRPGPAQVAATGPRARGREREYELLLEMILEGYRLHYDEPLVVRTAGRRPGVPSRRSAVRARTLAPGMLGDLDAVAELADVISLVALAHAASDRELASAVWEAGAISVGWGPSDAHAEAKAQARVHDPGAADALRAAACAVRSEPRRPACEVRIEVVRPARTAPLGDDLFAVMAVRCRQLNSP